MTIVAGLFIFVFGCLGAWLLGTRFPNARFLRAGYLCIALGGLLFTVWSLTHNLPVGVAGGLLALVGFVSGAIGALRKEVRVFPPT